MFFFFLFFDTDLTRKHILLKKYSLLLQMKLTVLFSINVIGNLKVCRYFQTLKVPLHSETWFLNG